MFYTSLAWVWVQSSPSLAPSSFCVISGLNYVDVNVEAIQFSLHNQLPPLHEYEGLAISDNLKCWKRQRSQTSF